VIAIQTQVFLHYCEAIDCASIKTKQIADYTPEGMTEDVFYKTGVSIAQNSEKNAVIFFYSKGSKRAMRTVACNDASCSDPIVSDHAALSDKSWGVEQAAMLSTESGLMLATELPDEGLKAAFCADAPCTTVGDIIALEGATKIKNKQ